MIEIAVWLIGKQGPAYLYRRARGRDTLDEKYRPFPQPVHIRRYTK